MTEMRQINGDCEMIPLKEIELFPPPRAAEKSSRKRSRFCLQSDMNLVPRATKEQQSSYWSLLRNNHPFRLFFASYTASHMGEWLTYLASIAALEQNDHEHQNGSEQGIRKTMIGVLIIVRLLPNVILAPFGGVLADGRDRRQSMVALDLTGALVGVLFILAIRQRSVHLIYAANFVQQCLAGLYEPCRSSIVPLLVSNERDLKMATTINGLTWSIVAAIGSSTGGILVSVLGLQGCFLIDSITYLMSALLMYMIPGSFAVTECDDDDHDNEGAKRPITAGALWAQVKDMLQVGVHYIWTSFFGALVLIKASAAVVYGACDVLNVAFSERGDPESTSSRLGVLFGCVGIGCLVGPLVFDRFTDMENPKSLQLVCILSMGQMACGSILMGMFYHYFWMTCLFTAVRSAGSSVVWINSSLLLQKFAAADLLGRVTSIDYSLALLSEAISAYVAGAVLDGTSLSPEEVSVQLGVVGCLLTGGWLVYNWADRGAASYDASHQKLNETPSSSESSVASETSHLMDTDQ